MVIDIIILLFVIAIILLIIAYEEASIAWTSLSFLFWVFLFAQTLHIEIPYHAWTGLENGSINVTTGAHVYTEYALSIVCFAVIIFNIIMLIVDVMDYQNRRRYRI
jgi:hypothetical protein